MTLPAVHRIALVAALLCAGCSGLLNPEAGLALPKDPGTVVVEVHDQLGAPVGDVIVHISDIPNSVGSTYDVGQWTNASGATTFSGIPAGRRRVEVTPPAGFRAVTDDVIKQIDVVKDTSVAVFFVLSRN